MSTHQQITIIGFLGDDPKLTVFEGGNTICNMSVATTETWKDKNTQEKKSWTEWHRVVLRHQLAELADTYLKKGDKVLIVGKMRTRSWEDSTGKKLYTTELQADKMVFMNSKSGVSEAKAEQQAAQEGPHQNTSSGDETSQNIDSLGNDKDDDLPF